jgi:hypothetical protein
MKLVHHYAMQQRRSLRPSVQQAELADTRHQLQQIHLTKTHGQQHHRHQHQQVVDGEHLLPTNHRSKKLNPTDNPFLVRKD